jgi:mannose-6-phosphate isomerase-like protein (cupin superfamily)
LRHLKIEPSSPLLSIEYDIVKVLDVEPQPLKHDSRMLCRRKQGRAMAAKREAFIRNIAEVPWLEFPDHFGGALSKPLVMPDTAGSLHIDYRISMYQPKAHVKKHSHKVQEQVYHVIEGEGLMHIAGRDHVVRKHDFIFMPPGVEHSIENTGLVDLVFLVVTSPVTDE